MGMMLRRHYEEEIMEEKKEEVKFICPECGREFKTEKGLNGHITKAHRNEDGDEDEHR